MSKRKQEVGDKVAATHPRTDDESGDEEDFDVLDVDFEWFDPQPNVDFQGIKTLLQQLFDVDAQLFDLSALTDLILSQPTLGSTVKVDGNETDAYAFLSILNLHEHQDRPVVAQLIRYLQGKSKARAALGPLSELLSQTPIPAVGLILTERLINVPAEVAPPMFSMLLEEMEWALQDKEPYEFSHYLILSKTYTEVASALDAEDDRPKKKKKAAADAFETMFFHPEDEVFQKSAVCHGGFDYSTTPDDGYSDSKRAFHELGIKPQGHAILLSAETFKDAVQNVAEYLKPQA